MRFVNILSIFLAGLIVSIGNAYIISIDDIANKKGENDASLRISYQKSNGICSTPECTAAASKLKESMDPTANPCEDFFQYACGGWIKKNPIPASKSSWDQMDFLNDDLSTEIAKILTAPTNPGDPAPVNKARNMYAACMNTALLETIGLRPLAGYLNQHGGWPMAMGNSWVNSSFDWQAAAAADISGYPGYLPQDGTMKYLYILIDIHHSLDSKNTSMSSIYIDQGSFILPRTTLVEPGTSPNTINAYAAYITGTAKAMRDFLKSGATDGQIEREAEAVWKFESELAKITSRKEDRRNSTRLYNPMSLTDVQTLTDSVRTTSNHAKIKWSKYLNDIYQVGAGIAIPSNERLIVAEREYLKKLVSLLDATPLRTIANFVHWRLVFRLSSATTKQMRDLQFEFNKAMYGATAPVVLSTSCAETVNSLLGYAVSNKYIEKNFNKEAKTEMQSLITNLKKAFKTIVDDATWMDRDTKIIAQEKADVMVENVAYPDWVINKTALENYYKGIIVTNTDHFNNLRSASAFLNSEDFKALRGPTDRTRWENIYPTVVNAFYAPKLNSLIFPAAFLQVPFFGYGRLAAQNYASIGIVIGHELTHGFDDRGRQRDKNGNTANWWTTFTEKNYLDRAKCFIDQYGNYTVPSGSHVNGVTTQGENIADNGGLREAFLAYKRYVNANGAETKLPGLEKFTSEQLFFLSYANIFCGSIKPEMQENLILGAPHSPNRFRVIGPLSNNEDFVREFKCPAGGPMNRVNKCTLW